MAFLLSACSSPLSDVTISSLDLGAVEPHRVHHGSVRVTNVGTSSTKLVRVERTSGSDRVTVTPTQVGFAPREEAAWNVTFTAGALGEVEATFVAVFDSGTTTFSVRALVAPPCEVEPFDVGDARVGTVVTRTFTLSNPLARSASVLLGESSAPFSVEGAGMVRLAAKETRAVDVIFAPQAEGNIERAWFVAPRTDCTAVSTSLRGRALAASLAFVPGRLHFGAVTLGGQATRSVELQNRSRSVVRVSAAMIDSNLFELQSTLPIELPAEGGASLVLRARSQSADTQAGTLTLTTDSPLQREVALPLLMNFTGPCLSVTPEQLEFGSVEVDCRSAASSITLSNRCPHAVVLSPLELPEGFALISANNSTRLEGSSSQHYGVAFAPTREGAPAGAITLTGDVLDGVERLEVAVSALAQPRPRIEESVSIPIDPLLMDVLLVIDDSPSMLEFESHVSENLDSFALTLRGLPSRVAVMSTSTSTGAVGRLRKTSTGASWLETPTREALQELGRVRGLSTGRSSCLEALRTAFTSSLRTDPTELGGFLRPGAMLSVMCITGGRDELETPALETILAIRDALPRRSEVGGIARFSAEVPFRTCSGTLDDGRLELFASELRDEFCAPGWTPVWSRFRRDGPAFETLFKLSRPPAFQRAPVQVFVDGVEYPPRDPEVNSRIWEWHSVLNAVQFEPLYAPEPGRRVTFRYTPDCPR